MVRFSAFGLSGKWTTRHFDYGPSCWSTLRLRWRWKEIFEHATTFGSAKGLTGGLSRHAWPGDVRQEIEIRAFVDPSGENAGVADKRMRLLLRYAFKGRTRGRRNGAAAVCAERSRRNAIRYRSRTRGADLDGSGHAGKREPCAGCGPRGRAAATLRRKTGEF